MKTNCNTTVGLLQCRDCTRVLKASEGHIINLSLTGPQVVCPDCYGQMMQDVPKIIKQPSRTPKAHRQTIEDEYFHYRDKARRYETALTKIRKAARPYKHEQCLGWIYRKAQEALMEVDNYDI